MEDLLAPFRKQHGRERPSDAHNAFVDDAAEKYAALLTEGVGETKAHRFLRANPYLVLNLVMGGGAPLERVALFSKVKLGDEKVTDFAFVTADSDGARWTLIELEDPRAKLFTKQGNPTATLTHGLRQLDDWSGWIRNDVAYAKRRFAELHHSAEIRGPADVWREPTFMLVIGREIMLTPETRRLKAEMNNQNPRRQIATFDRLNPRRWHGDTRPAGVLDDVYERGGLKGRPAWPDDANVDWKLSPRMIEAISEAKRTGKTIRLRPSDLAGAPPESIPKASKGRASIPQARPKTRRK